MKNPSLYIKMTELRRLLHENASHIAPKAVLDEVVNICFKNQSQYSIKNRFYIGVSSKDKSDKKKKGGAVPASTHPLFLLFQKTLIDVRRERFHKNLIYIDESHRNFASLYQVYQNAVEYCNLFDYEFEFGFRRYITCGFKLVYGAFYIQKLQSLHDKICEFSNLEREIENDPNFEVTHSIYAYYVSFLREFLNYEPNVSDPEYYIDFVRTSAAVVSVGAPWRDWMDAQFEYASSKGRFPNIRWFYGDLSTKIYFAYKWSKNPVVPKKYKSDAERMYYEAMLKNTLGKDEDNRL